MMRKMHSKFIYSVMVLIFLAVNGSSGSFAKEIEYEKDPSNPSGHRFVDMGDGTIMDTQTHLMWMELDYWQINKKWVNWYSAQEFAGSMNNKNFGGYSDWRLPTPEEGKSLYNPRKRNFDKDQDKVFMDPVFPKGPGWATWTSFEKGERAVIVSFKNKGGGFFQDKLTGQDAFVRLVRGPVGAGPNEESLKAGGLGQPL